MADVDMRGILEAFAEKGWVLYEETGNLEEELMGPVDNLVPDVLYRVMPETPDPHDMSGVRFAAEQVAKRNMLYFEIEIVTGDETLPAQSTFTSLAICKDGTVFLVPDMPYGFPLESFEEAVRKYVSVNTVMRGEDARI